MFGTATTGRTSTNATKLSSKQSAAQAMTANLYSPSCYRRKIDMLDFGESKQNGFDYPMPLVEKWISGSAAQIK